jgi:hypothetical protein
MKTSETDVREALRVQAETFDMPDEVPDHLNRTIHRRRSRNGALAGLGSASLATLVGALVFAVSVAGPGGPPPSNESRTGVKQVSYVLLDAKVSSELSPPSWLSDHIECMRSQGFDLPDPTQTADGWSITVDDPAAAGFGTAAWREAAFVTCAPDRDRPLSGNFILGFPKEKVDSFVACMAGQGYQLPEPTTNADGEYVFDLTDTNIDTASSAWDEAVFVTCSLD